MGKGDMSEKLRGLRDKPIHIDEKNWYYEERKGLCLIHEVYQNGIQLDTAQIYIPWKKLLESVKRKYPGLKMGREK